MIRDENGLLAGYVYVDTRGRRHRRYVEEAKAAVARAWRCRPATRSVERPVREHAARRERLRGGGARTLVLIFLLLYANTVEFKAMVMLAVPFSAVGAVWLLYLLDYNVSIAAWVGMIALMGLDAETGVFMLLFLDLSHDEREGARAAAHTGRTRTRPSSTARSSGRGPR
jgi:Cu(I)/Ag(I) efflux system membrane protein CusA/SilA